MSGGELGRAVHLGQTLIAEVLPCGGTAVDATAGNGNDTLFLAELVGINGRVYAFDVQEKALWATQELLTKHGVDKQVTLLRRGHQEMEKLVPGPVNAVLFNLGYLPGGDHGLVTRPDTTVAALRSATKLLCRGGRICLVLYPGHPGGEEELAAVKNFASELSGTGFHALEMHYLNRSARAPVIIMIEKARAGGESQTST